MSRFWGAGSADALFNGHPTRTVPLQRASRRKDRRDYDQSVVNEGLKSPNLESVDPRTVAATQPAVTRAGVQHYLSGAEGRYADQHNVGNVHPVVYDREDGQRVLLSGHHRAVAALLQGRQFTANVIRGPWGPERG